MDAYHHWWGNRACSRGKQMSHCAANITESNQIASIRFIQIETERSGLRAPEQASAHSWRGQTA